MTRYISNADNLKMIMNMLRDKSRNIQFEAFHVFKVFVANPNKAKAIQDILLKNQERLVDFLTKFHNDRTGESPDTIHHTLSASLMKTPLGLFKVS
jgi:calcium binding protein 39